MHLTTQVALRSTLNNFNLSSPSQEESYEKYETSADMAALVDSTMRASIEAGLLAENELFKCRINWRMSPFYESFNLKYFVEFLEKFLNEKEMKFDVEKSGIIQNNSMTSNMPIDADSWQRWEPIE